MVEAISAPRPQKPARTLREWLTRNPVILKELRGRMRGWRAFGLLSFHVVALSGFITLLYALYVSAVQSPSSGIGGQWVGKIVFGGVVGMELLLASFITPALTAGAISGERERQTFDLLRTTLLSGRALVLGKLGAALSFVLILLVAGLPLQSLAFLLGGVGPEEFLVGTALLISTAFLFGTAGMFFSSLMHRTLGATVLTYAFALLLVLALPLSLMIVVPVLGFMYSSSNVVLETLLVYTLGLLIVINPIATAVTTQILLVDSTYHTLFYFALPISGGVKLPLVSPWLPYLLFSLGLGALLLLLSVWRVNRAET